jgi:hypothetical protein
VWFMLAAVVLVPGAFDGVLSAHWTKPRSRLVNRAIAACAVLAALWVAGGSLSRDTSWYRRDYPDAASTAVARVADRNPGLRVFAHERFADWLVLDHPELRGRIAFDGRFELLRTSELKRIVEFRGRVEGAARITDGYGVLVLDANEKKLAASLLASRRRHVIYRDAHVVVIRQLPRSESVA